MTTKRILNVIFMFIKKVDVEIENLVNYGLAQTIVKDASCEKWQRAKIRISHISASIYHTFTIYHSKYTFWEKKTEQILTMIYFYMNMSMLPVKILGYVAPRTSFFKMSGTKKIINSQNYDFPLLTIHPSIHPS